MPMYSWKDETSGKQVDIIRKFDASDEPPKRDDISPKDMSDAEVDEAKWTKVLNNPAVVKGRGWGGGKGYW